MVVLFSAQGGRGEARAQLRVGDTSRAIDDFFECASADAFWAEQSKPVMPVMTMASVECSYRILLAIDPIRPLIGAQAFDETASLLSAR